MMSDEISMSTPGIDDHAVLTLRSISDDSALDLLGMNVLSDGYLLLHPPLIQGFS
jgi:hypothetical protein